ncbi:hypothetical protein LshimejAT787_0700100 [Lyophyllum shimeji]|uniref:Uncharacterized protein n=1 Tax=Lyophyllum shimeji TaxID=47721 RepID=A0A9P3PP69_LYOSH|nr:hypothetical protein LshimejAT787_0700100 [Lyophyllum shimeji]
MRGSPARHPPRHFASSDGASVSPPEPVAASVPPYPVSAESPLPSAPVLPPSVTTGAGAGVGRSGHRCTTILLVTVPYDSGVGVEQAVHGAAPTPPVSPVGRGWRTLSRNSPGGTVFPFTLDRSALAQLVDDVLMLDPRRGLPPARHASTRDPYGIRQTPTPDPRLAAHNRNRNRTCDPQYAVSRCACA